MNNTFESEMSRICEIVILEIPLDELYPPEFHPFLVNDDEAMLRLARNIKRYGVREPGLARIRNAEGGYELLSGNRRKRACELAGLTSMPVIVSEMDDDESVIAMVDANLEHRQRLLHSERAWAYRIKMEALNHSGVKGGTHSVDVLVEQTGESRTQIFRLIRLTELVPALLDMVDVKRLAFNPAVELSYLTRKEQILVVDTMTKYEVKPSLSQAGRLKRASQGNGLSISEIEDILSETKKPTDGFDTGDDFRRFFPASYTTKQIRDVIFELLIGWQESQSH